MTATSTRLRRITRSAARLAGLGLVLYAAALTWLWFQQEQLLFAPTVLPADHSWALARDVNEVVIDVPGARLSALHLRLPNPKGVVFFLHGNGGSLENWFVNPSFYRRANYDLFMFDYRGFGKSTGQIESEAQLRADVRAAWLRWHRSTPGARSSSMAAPWVRVWRQAWPPSWAPAMHPT